MKRLIDRLFYLIENAFVRSTVFQLLGVAALILAISMTGGAIVWAFSPDFNDFWASAWWAFLRLTDPGYLGDDTGTLARFVSTVLTILGYVLFLGALVAIMTTWLDRALGFLRSGRSHIFERDHILIIGWNSQMHALIEEVVHAKERVQRRLGRNRLPGIAILTDDYESTMLADVRQRLKTDVRDEARLLIRSGNPLEPEALNRVDFKRASSIILIPPGENVRRRHLADITLIKVLMTLRSQAEGIDVDDLPNLVVNISNPANKLLAESVGFPGRTEAIASDEFIGRLFCQAIRHPGMVAVSNHLLTDTWGESVFITPATDLGIVGKKLEGVLLDFEDSVPIGYVAAGTGEIGRVHLLALDTPLRDGDEIISIAPSYAAVKRGYSPERGKAIRTRLAETEHPARERTGYSPASRRVLIVGWSHLINQLLHELGQYDQEDFDVHVVTEVRTRTVKGQVNDVATQYENITMTYHQAELHRPEEVARIRPETFDNIVFLAPEVVDDPLLADAETVMGFVLVQERLTQMQATDHVAIAVELNEEDNRPLLRDWQSHDVVMTSEIVAHLLSQIAVRRALAWIYEDLFTQGGPEVRFRRFDRFFDLDGDGEFSFDECQLASNDAGSIAIGVKFAVGHGDVGPGMHLNLDRHLRFRPDSGDRLIVIEPEERLDTD